MSNHLADQTSPYLLQHKDNPVEWYPWCEEAFVKALKEDKPIFLSVGYSTCHWCHVMAHESFEDTETADMLNDAFVCIKVDREERPDIDSVYMSACHLITGSGGWPLTVVMTPTGKPFFAGTYIPKKNRYSRIGLEELVPKLKDIWENDRTRAEGTAAQVTQAVNQAAERRRGKEPTVHTLDRGFTQLQDRFDEDYGGFGDRPKFPSPHNLIFLLEYGVRKKEKDAVDMVRATLEAMRAGGIYDHVGGGFHRYSTDRYWQLPHFEKMLYDQALLVMAYAKAYEVLKEPWMAYTVKETLEFVERELMSDDGTFYTALDADSDGEEGKFYVWSMSELKKLGTKELFKPYHIKKEGNFNDEATRKPTGANILFQRRPFKQPNKKVQEVLNKLRKEREKRVRPGLDSKVLTDMNGLMIAAFATAGRILNESSYIERAEKAADRILQTRFGAEGKLMHTDTIPGFLDDHAFLAWGLKELDKTTGSHGKEVNNLVRSLEEFAHPIGGYYMTSSDELISKPIDFYDGAIPSGNAVIAYVMDDPWPVVKGAAWELEKLPSGHTFMLLPLGELLGWGTDIKTPK